MCWKFQIEIIQNSLALLTLKEKILNQSSNLIPIQQSLSTVAIQKKIGQTETHLSGENISEN